VTAGELAAMLPIARPGGSRHLRVLREAGLGDVRQEAQRRGFNPPAPAPAPGRGMGWRGPGVGARGAGAPRTPSPRGETRTKEHAMNGSARPGMRLLASLRSVDGKGVVRVEDRIATDIDDVWSALTDPERLARWYGRVEGDLRLGGEFRLFVDASGWE